MNDKPTKTANQIVSVPVKSRFNRRKIEYFAICNVVESEFKALAAINEGFGTWYNCIDSRGKKAVIFDAFNKDDFIVHSRGKWLGGDNT